MTTSTREKVDALEAQLREHEQRQNFISKFDSTQKIFIGIWFFISLAILVLLAQFQPFFILTEDEETDEKVVSYKWFFIWFFIFSIISGILIGFGWYKCINKKMS